MVFGEDSREQSLDIDRPVATGWLDFVKLGIVHILTGYDPSCSFSRCWRRRAAFGA